MAGTTARTVAGAAAALAAWSLIGRTRRMAACGAAAPRTTLRPLVLTNARALWHRPQPTIVCCARSLPPPPPRDNAVSLKFKSVKVVDMRGDDAEIAALISQAIRTAPPAFAGLHASAGCVYLPARSARAH